MSIYYEIIPSIFSYSFLILLVCLNCWNGLCHGKAITTLDILLYQLKKLKKKSCNAQFNLFLNLYFSMIRDNLRLTNLFSLTFFQNFNYSFEIFFFILPVSNPGTFCALQGLASYQLHLGDRLDPQKENADKILQRERLENIKY